ncbi:MAG TPA: nucleotidyltransferase domain-containing protein [Solirubrobacterales bacterium]|nr:nucleotidyltransferase domain-containing protein [Solirubrobacterales bacterium]
MSQLRTLAEDLGVDERTLRRAAGQGTLRAERLSPRKLKIAPGEAGYLRRSWPLLAALRGALRTEPNVAFALLFGSAARGDDGADSDLDLIVALRDSSLDGMVELQDRLERRLGREVDVLSVEAASSNDLLISTAVGEGRVLVDRINLWPGLRSELGALRQRADRGSKRDRQRTLAEIDRFLS